MNTFLQGFLTRLLFSSLLLCVSAAAQVQPPASYKLIAVKVTGSKRFTQEEVAAASGLPVGTIVHEEDFKKAARQLGETGAFTKNITYTYSYSSAGTRLEFQVTDAEKFVPARFADFVWFTDEELLQKLHERVPLFKGELPTNGRMPDQVSDVLQAMLVENGIPGHVEYLRTNGKDERIESIDYNVAGVSIRIHRVEFAGAEAGEMPLLQTAAERLLDREYSRAFMTNFIEHALLPIYHEHGYLKASCAPPQLKVVKVAAADAIDNKQPPTFVDVTFPVTPGLHYKLTRWEWSGNKEISTTRSTRSSMPRRGKPRSPPASSTSSPAGSGRATKRSQATRSTRSSMPRRGKRRTRSNWRTTCAPSGRSTARADISSPASRWISNSTTPQEPWLTTWRSAKILSTTWDSWNFADSTTI